MRWIEANATVPSAPSASTIALAQAKAAKTLRWASVHLLSRLPHSLRRKGRCRSRPFATSTKEVPMKGASAVTALFVALLCVGCSDRGSPAGPSSVRADSLPTNSAAGQAASQGASVSPTPAAATVPFKGTFEGSQTTTPLEPPLAFSVVSATGTATHLGRFTLEIPHTVNFATSDRRWDIHVHGGERRHADRRLHRDCGHAALRLSQSRSTRRSRVAQVDSRERRELSPPTGCSIRSTARPPVRSRGPFRRLVPESRETEEATTSDKRPKSAGWRRGWCCWSGSHLQVSEPNFRPSRNLPRPSRIAASSAG